MYGVHVCTRARARAVLRGASGETAFHAIHQLGSTVIEEEREER